MQTSQPVFPSVAQTYTSQKPEDLIRIGQIKSAFGIQGWVWIYSETDPLVNIFKYQPWWVKLGGTWKTLTVAKSKIQGKGLVARIAGIENRNLAESLHGVEIFVSESSIPVAAPNEYYWKDLFGVKVFGLAAENSADPAASVLLGEITDLFSTGANDVMVVSPTLDSIDSEERLIPWHRTTLGEIDMKTRQMNVIWRSDY